MKSKTKVLLLLILVFAAPGICAYLFYQHPQWLSVTSTNRGTLLTPPVLFPYLPGKDKWGLLLWSPEDCAQECVKELDQLARVRLALGRRLYQVDQWLVTNADAIPPSLTTLLKEQDIQLLTLQLKQINQLPLFDQHPHVFITNPQHYLILSYAPSAKPEDVFHDLKQLLTMAENKNG